MPQNTKEIKNLLAQVSGNVTSLDMLIEFEKTLDNANLYAYKNWLSGELVNGPEISKYWFTTWWMYPHKLMPDPRGGMRLTKYGCKVKFSTDILETPVRIKGPSSYEESGDNSRAAKLKENKVWIVEIQMPRKFIDESILADLEGDVDVSEIEDAYNEGLNTPANDGGENLESSDMQDDEGDANE